MTDLDSPLYQTQVTSKVTHAQTWATVLLFLAFAGIAVWYASVIPTGEAVDELPHFQYVLHVKETGRLPVQPQTLAEGVDVWMGHHPPLYYAFGALITLPFDTSGAEDVFVPNSHFVWRENDGRNGWNVMQHFGQDVFPWQGAVLALQALRIANIMLTIVGLYALLLAGRLMFGPSSWLPLGIIALIAFNPSFLFMTTTVHHDVLQSAIFAFGVLWIVYLLKKDDVSNVFYILGGVLAAAALLTKISGVVLGLTFVVALFLKAYRTRAWRQFIVSGLYTFVPTVALAGWWYLRNYLLYGDPLGWDMFLNIHQHMVRHGAYTFNTFIDEFLGQISRTFWGAFGYMHITFPEIARTFWILASIAFLGFILALLRGRLRLRQSWEIWLSLLLMMILLFVSFFRFSLATVGAGHARYLFPVIFLLATIIIIGLNELTTWRFQRGVTLFLGIGLALYCVWLPATLVLPKYAPPETLTLSTLPEQAEEVNIALAPGLTLAAYDVGGLAKRVAPGQPVQVTLYWRSDNADAEIQDRKYVLTIESENNTYAAYSDWPVRTLAPANWQQDRLYTSSAILTLPPDDLPGQVGLKIALADDNGQVQEDSAIGLMDFVSAGATVSVTQEVFPNPQNVIFGDQLRLLGFNSPTAAVSPGAIVPIELFWEAVVQPQEDYTVFVHVTGADNQLVTQYDRPVGGDSLPTSTWERNDVYSDIHPVEIPEDLPAGQYTLRIGLYSWPSLERLQITNAGADNPDSFTLSSIQVISQE